MYSAFLLGLSLIGAASAQVANGVVAVPMPGLSAGSSAPAVTASASASGSASPSGSSPSPAQTSPSSYGGSSAPPNPQYTPPPYYETSSAMPYSHFQSGGYKSMDCGYGYQKGGDGSCQKMSWVRVKRSCHIGACTYELIYSTRTLAATRRSSSISKSIFCLRLSVWCIYYCNLPAKDLATVDGAATAAMAVATVVTRTPSRLRALCTIPRR